MEAASIAIGSIYLLAWSASFYPTLLDLINLNRAAHCAPTDALLLQSKFLSFLGYIFYSIFCLTGSFLPSLGTGIISTQDSIFAYHGLLLSTAILSLILSIPEQSLSFNKLTLSLSILIFLVFLLMLLLETGFGLAFSSSFNTVILVGFFKPLTLFLQNMPRARLNCKTQQPKSLKKWMILLDLVGAIGSIIQAIIDSRSLQNQSLTSPAPSLNLVKCVLGMTVIVFDFVYLFQYWVYR